MLRPAGIFPRLRWPRISPWPCLYLSFFPPLARLPTANFLTWSARSSGFALLLRGPRGLRTVAFDDTRLNESLDVFGAIKNFSADSCEFERIPARASPHG